MRLHSIVTVAFVLVVSDQLAGQVRRPQTLGVGLVGDAKEHPFPQEIRNVTRTIISELQRSASAGDAVAQNYLAFFYTYGVAVPQDYREAVRWYKASATQGLSTAQYNLGGVYEQGEGVPKSYEQAFSYLSCGCRTRSRASTRKTGTNVRTRVGRPRGRSSCHEVVSRCSRARKRASSVPACVWILREQGPSQRLSGGSQMVPRSREQGVPETMSNLGVLYQHGLGVEKDFQQAARWYRAAAEDGVGEAQYDLASLYMAGKGVPLDYANAYYWYSLARSAGDTRAIRQLKDLERLMGTRQLSEARAHASNCKRAGALAKTVGNESFTEELPILGSNTRKPRASHE